MAVPKSYQRYAEIAESIGFTLDVEPASGSAHGVFHLQHPHSNSELSLDEDNGKKVLDFLNVCHWSADRGLDQRVEALERKINAQTEAEMPFVLSDYEPNETHKDRFHRLWLAACGMGAKLERSGSYDEIFLPENGQFKEPTQVKYTSPAEALGKTYSFTLPQDFPQLERLMAANQQSYQQALNGIKSADGGFSILEAFQRDGLADELRALAENAGGILGIGSPDVNGRFQVTYRRYHRLRIATLPDLGVSGRGRRSDDGYVYHRLHTIIFDMPYKYDLLRKVLENDIEVYNKLPKSAKRPANW